LVDKAEESGDPPSVQRTAMDLLNEQLADPSLSSSTRVLILILLSVHKKMGHVELLQFTGLGRSSLGNHLGKLEAAGYIRTRMVKSFLGRRQVIEITKKGLEECRTLLERIQSLDV
jgi:DNA-binding MarR family transcriptional regulator